MTYIFVHNRSSRCYNGMFLRKIHSKIPGAPSKIEISIRRFITRPSSSNNTIIGRVKKKHALEHDFFTSLSLPSIGKCWLKNFCCRACISCKMCTLITFITTRGRPQNEKSRKQCLTSNSCNFKTASEREENNTLSLPLYGRWLHIHHESVPDRLKSN